MRHSRLLVFFFTATLFAADSSLSKPGLDQLPPQMFDQLLRKGLDNQATDRLKMWTLAKNQLAIAMATNQCAISLLEYRVKHPERYTMRSLHVGSSPDAMSLPAMPVCK